MNKITMALIGAATLGLAFSANLAISYGYDWAGSSSTFGYDWAGSSSTFGYDWAGSSSTFGYDWAGSSGSNGYDWALPDPSAPALPDA